VCENHSGYPRRYFLGRCLGFRTHLLFLLQNHPPERPPTAFRRSGSSEGRHGFCWTHPFGDGQVMLVDCGNDPMAKAILVGLSQMGLGHEAVRTILLPHARPDHIAGCTAFPDAEVFAMAAEQSLLEGRTAARSPIGFLLGKKNSGIRVTRDLSSCRLISTRQRHGDFVLGPRAYRRQCGLSGRGTLILVKTEGCYRQRDS